MSRNYGGSMVANMFVKFGADTTEYQKKMRAAVTRMLFAAESLTQAGRIMSTAITAPMLMVGAASLKVAMQFEDAMTRMVSLVGMPAETIAKWSPIVQQMAGIVGKSANELAEALFFITSNGIRSEQALKVLESTAKASAVGLGETKDVAIAATSALNAYGKGAMTADESVAVLIGTIREGNLEAAELPSALSRLLPVAAALGVEFHEAGAGIAAMSRSGTSARLAAFGLRAVMLSIASPTHAATAAMKEAGIEAATLDNMMGEQGLMTTLLHMRDAAEAENVSLRDLFPNKKAYVAVLQMLGKTVEENIEIFDNMAKVVGEDVEDAFQKGAHTMKRTYDQAMGDLSSTAIDLGNNLAPLIDKFGELAKKASATAKAYNELNDTQKGIVDGLAFFLIAIGPVTYALGSLSRMAARFVGLSILIKAPWVKAAAGFGMTATKAGFLTTTLAKLGLTVPGVAAAFATGIASYKLTQELDKAVGTTKALNEEFGRFGTAATTIGEDLAKGGKRMEDMADQSYSLAFSIGETGLAFALQDARMAGNYNKMGKIITAIDNAAAAYNKATIEVEGMTEAQTTQADNAAALKEANEELAAEEGERLKKLRETNKLLTAQDVKDASWQLIKDRKDLIALGIPLNRINEEQVDDLKELAEWSKAYGVGMSDSMKQAAASMNEQGLFKDSEFFKTFDYYIPKSINMMPGKVIPGMVKMGDEVAEKLTGGLGRGFADGIDNFNQIYRPQLKEAINSSLSSGFIGFGTGLRDQIHALADLMNPITIKVVPDPDVWNEAFQDVIDGKYPPTGG